MMMIKKVKYILSLLAISCILGATLASADSDSSKAKNSIKRIKNELKFLKKAAKNAKIRTILAQYTSNSSSFLDSDSDGLPDVIENALGSNSCDLDSDDDGLSDDEEGNSGSNPDDSLSGEVELTGLITNLTATTVTVGGKTFTLGSVTQFRDGKTLASFSVGEKVEVEGRIVSGVLTLNKIKTED